MARPNLLRSVCLWLGLAVPAVSHAETVRLRIDDTPVAKIADDFIGFGYETSAIAQPDFFSAKNQRMVRLYRNLSPGGLIRIGGIISDHARFEAGGKPVVATERGVTVYTQPNLNDLADFAKATGWRVMWGLNLGTGTKEQAADEAVAVSGTLGSSLQSFEIGNETEQLKRFGGKFDAFHAAYRDFKAAVRAKVPASRFSGPDSAWSVPWVEQFVAAEAPDLVHATHHYYCGGARSKEATIEHMLAPDAKQIERLTSLRALSEKHRVPYRFNEVNSFYGGGKPGVSDTFASALWCLDYLYTLAAHGCGGVNMETDINQLGFVSHYSPIGRDKDGQCMAKPEYYGMLAFVVGGRGEVLKADAGPTAANATAYVTRAADGTCVTVVNKDAATDLTVEIPWPAGRTAARVLRLTGPALDAKDGVSFAGSRVADDGRWTAGDGEAAAADNGIVRVAVPHASAVVVRIR